MKTTLFIVSSLLMFSSIGCQTKTSKNSNQTKDKQEIAEQETPGANQQLVPLHEGAFNGSLDAVKVHINNKENLNATNPDGHTPLMLASYNGHTLIIKELLENGANINVSDNQGLTPLHFAASGAFPKAVELLLENGANINATDKIENFTPLMYAASEGNVGVVKILLENDADILMVDKDGDNAETFARQNNHIEIVEILRNSTK